MVRFCTLGVLRQWARGQKPSRPPSQQRIPILGKRTDFSPHRQCPRLGTGILARYREPSHARSVFELLITAGSFVALWVLMWAALGLGYWLSLIIAVPTAGFLVRLFMIQHDCGHGSLLPPPRRQRLGRARDRRADVDAVRCLAA